MAALHNPRTQVCVQTVPGCSKPTSPDVALAPRTLSPSWQPAEGLHYQQEKSLHRSLCFLAAPSHLHPSPPSPSHYKHLLRPQEEAGKPSAVVLPPFATKNHAVTPHSFPLPGGMGRRIRRKKAKTSWVGMRTV